MSQVENSRPLFGEGAGRKKKDVTKGGSPWKILIVDDEEEVHSVTQMALKSFSFGNRGLLFLHAYSAKEAKDCFNDHDDIALVLLDVVMESDHAGLDTVKYIREEIGNRLTRIVLRTGQPGQAPEKQVITDYDINDYKEKTELTSQKLFTLMSTSLRNYRDMVALDRSRSGLKLIINSSASIFSVKSMRKFAEGALGQMLALLHVKEAGSFFGSNTHSLAACKEGQDFRVLAGTGKYSVLAERPDDLGLIPKNVLQHLGAASSDKGHIVESDHVISYYQGRSGHENLLYVSGDFDLNDIDESLLELYSRNVGLAFENIELHDELEETQREIVFRLGEAVETRSTESGNHLKRVAAISSILGREYGLSQRDVEILEYAAPLHDVGKIGIPDAILNKPGELTPEERDVIKTHAELGYQMLFTSNRPILKAGAIIARTHHEKWDGTGYPFGTKGEDIPIMGRIVAIADVCDALAHSRKYRDPWPLDRVFGYVHAESGKSFDPELVKVFARNIAKVEQVMALYAR